MALLIVFQFILGGFAPFHIAPPEKAYLAFSLMPSANSGLVTYAIVCVHDNSKREIIPISRNEFLRLATGQVASDVNPNKENLLEKYEIQDCGFYNDNIAKKLTYECSVVDNIWKLRYGPFPYKTKSKQEGGWARGQDNFPSDGQLSTLYKYGIERLNDLFIGENAFKLLKDMQNPDWVSTYQGS